MDKKQLGGIFIAVLMIGSIIGFSVLFSGNGDSGSFPDGTDNVNLPDSTVIPMIALDVEAKVVEILPKILFSAFTNEANINAIDSKIASVEGIYRIDSKYRQFNNTTFGTSLVYVAEISFDKTKSVPDMVEKVNNATEEILFEPFSYELVLVSVPKNVIFFNSQGFDLNHSFDDPLTLAYVLPGSLKEDELLVRIDASFTGKTMVNSTSSEIKNLTSEPKFLLFDLNKSITEKLPRIVFGSFVDFSDYLNENSLKERISSLNEVLDVNVVSVKPENYFIVFFDAETDLKGDFNSFMFDKKTFTSIEVSAVGKSFSAQLYFNEEQEENIRELEETVISFLEEKNASDISISESVSQAFGSIELSSPDSGKTVSELTDLLNSLNFRQIQIQQQVTVLFDSFLNDEGKEFVPDEKTLTEVFVRPSRKIGEEVFLRIEVQTVRDNIVSITAAEE